MTQSLFLFILFPLSHHSAEPTKCRHEACGEGEDEGEVDEEIQYRDRHSIVHKDHAVEIFRISVGKAIQADEVHQQSRKPLHGKRKGGNAGKRDMLLSREQDLFLSIGKNGQTNKSDKAKEEDKGHYRAQIESFPDRIYHRIPIDARCKTEISDEAHEPGFRTPKSCAAELLEAEKRRKSEGKEQNERGEKISREDQ
jgi:hypothetical protein